MSSWLSRLHRRKIKLKKLLNNKMWGAPGIKHVLFDGPRPTVKLDSDSPPADRALVRRVANIYQKHSNTYDHKFEKGESITKLKQALDDHDVGTLSDFFGNLFQGDLLDGMGLHRSYYDGDKVWMPGFKELQLTDLMLSLGEAIGVLSIPNNAQMKVDKYIEYLWTDQDKLFFKIQDALGFSLEMPAVGRPPVFQFNATNTNADLIKHSYAVHRIKEMKFKPTDAILEIGGGFGALALLVYRAGYRNYTIIDMPAVCSIQQFYLASVFGAERVSGFGELKKDIQILPPASFKEVPDKSVALVVNTDSFPEIEKSEAIKYLFEIRRTADYFLSINQEAQATHQRFSSPQTMVSELINEVGGFERVYRFPYWMLEGYVEELYRVVR